MHFPTGGYLGQRLLSKCPILRGLGSSFARGSWDLFQPSYNNMDNNINIRRRTLVTTTKVSALSLNAKKRKGKKITMVTAYDFPSAIQVARAGIDVILVGDSVAMVELGHETTQQLNMDDILHHCISVHRGLEFVKSGSLLVGDMPFGSYEFEDTDVALRNAYRFVKEGGCDAVKLEVRIVVNHEGE
jgi:Ketopantoate hydroxymethyltransferase